MSNIHREGQGLSLYSGLLALMNQSSGNIEQITREALQAVAGFVQNQGGDVLQGGQSSTGNLSTPQTFGAAAAEEFKDLFDFRAEGNRTEAEWEAVRQARRAAGEPEPVSLSLEETLSELNAEMRVPPAPRPRRTAKKAAAKR